jgi:peptidoglycan/LPS O-acetylase OafA/YrhL
LLEGLRGVAALVVAFIHLPSGRFNAVFPRGYLAVDLFFLLSGFVLSYAYRDRLRSDLTVGQFARLRFVRLWPMYVIGATFGVLAFEPFAGVRPVLMALPNLLMLPAADAVEQMHRSFPLNAPAWSLFWELTVGLGLAALMRHRLERWLATAALLGFLALIPVALTSGGLNVGGHLPDFAGGLPRAVFGIAAGALLEQRRVEWRVALPSLSIAAAVAVFLIHPPRALAGVFDLLAVAALFPAVLLHAANARPGPRLGAVWDWLGARSYPLYAIHLPLFVLIYALVRRPLGTAPPAVQLLAGCAEVASALLLSAVLERWIEQPLRAWLAARASAWPGARRLRVDQPTAAAAPVS